MLTANYKTKEFSFYLSLTDKTTFWNTNIYAWFHSICIVLKFSFVILSDQVKICNSPPKIYDLAAKVRIFKTPITSNLIDLATQTKKNLSLWLDIFNMVSFKYQEIEIFFFQKSKKWNVWKFSCWNNTNASTRTSTLFFSTS